MQWVLLTPLLAVDKSSFSIALICTTSPRIPASASANHGSQKDCLIPMQWVLLTPFVAMTAMLLLVKDMQVPHPLKSEIPHPPKSETIFFKYILDPFSRYI